MSLDIIIQETNITSRILNILSFYNNLNEKLQFKIITTIVLENVNDGNIYNLQVLNSLDTIKCMNCNIKDDSMNDWFFPNLKLLVLNNCGLYVMPIFIMKSKHIVELHLENNKIMNISNEILKLKNYI